MWCCCAAGIDGCSRAIVETWCSSAAGVYWCSRVVVVAVEGVDVVVGGHGVWWMMRHDGLCWRCSSSSGEVEECTLVEKDTGGREVQGRGV